uniref:Kinetochore scaffold 1 isoform X2 n=1 Tax=Geotrypetes seraphini TaxID=260995 RepID=A0A6P8RUI1_GEOSA|nr:kinetochore scaffold 1 isoform X2 [Geotrypetes seraphini]
MEDSCIPQNENNDQTDHVHRKRLSSILKAPRSPLQDLGGGNEIYQDHNLEKRRKNSRRVSFAETISSRVFVPDLHENVIGELSNAGMDSLFPTPVQQSQWHISNTYKQTRSHEKTVVFSDENDMDITSSNTIIITQNLMGNPEIEKTPKKIDFLSFLTGLNTGYKVPALTSDCCTTSEPGLANSACFSFQSEKQTYPEKNINDFQSSLKPPEETVKPLLKNEKENLFTCVPEANILSLAEKTYSHSQTQENSKITHCSNELDNAIDMTQYHASNMKTIFSTTDLLPNKIGVEGTGSERMDISGTRYLKVYKHNLSNNLTEVSCNNSRQEKESPIIKIGFSAQCPDPKICYEEATEKFDDINITRSHAVLINNSHLEETDRKNIKPFPSFEPPDNKTIVYESLGDMELSKKHTIAVWDRNSEAASNISFKEASYRTGKALSSVERDNITLSAKTVVFSKDGSDIDLSNSHTVSVKLKTVLSPIIPDDRTTVFSVDGGDSFLPVKQQNFQVPKDYTAKTLTFSELNEMDITKSNTVAIDKFVDEEGGLSTQLLQRNSNRKSMTGLRMSSVPIDQTIVFSKAEDDMDITQSQSMAINRNCMLLSERAYLPLPLVSDDKTVVFTCDQDEMDVTKSHTVAIDKVLDEVGGSNMQPLQSNSNRKSVTSLRISSIPDDQTIVFSKTEDMTLTNNHSMTINRNSMLLGETHQLPMPPVYDDKTVVFTCDKDEMDITKSHTVAIDNKVADEMGYPSVQPLQRNTNRKSINERVHLPVPATSSDEADLLTCDQEMDITKSHTVAIDNRVIEEAGGSNIQTLQRKSIRKSMTTLRMPSVPVDQTILFPKAADDMDLTQSYSMAINGNSMLLGVRQQLPVAPVSDDKTVVFTCDQDEMDITKSHTVAIDNRVVDEAGSSGMQPLKKNTYRKSMNKSVNFPVPTAFSKKTIMFTSDNDEMDITKSHTLGNDNRVVDETGDSSTQALQRNSSRKSMTTLRMPSVPIDQTILFPKAADDMDLTQSHSMAISRNSMLLDKRQQLQVPPVSSDKTVVFTCDQDEMDITKSHTVAIDNRIIEEAGGSNIQTLQRKSIRKSMTTLRMPSIPVDQTILFPKAADDMDLTQSHSMAINGNSMLLGVRQQLPVAPVSDDKTVVFTCDQDEMDITKSHTVAIDNRVVDEAGSSGIQPLKNNTYRKSMNESVNFPVPAAFSKKTIMFTSDNDEIDITKSHTLANDNRVVDETGDSSTQALQRNSNRKNMTSLRMSSIPIDQTIIFSKAEDVMDLTQSHNMAPMLVGERQQLQVPPVSSDKTVVFTCNQDEMDITKSHTIAIDKVMDEARGSGMQPLQRKSVTGLRSSSIPVDQTIVFSNTEDMDLTQNHSMAVNRNTMLLGERQHLSAPSVSDDKTMVFTCYQDEMDITKSHTVAIDNRLVDEAGDSGMQPLKKNTYRKSMNESVNFPVPAVSSKKAIMLTRDNSEMNFIKSHTLSIDNRVVEETRGSSTQTLQRNGNRKSMTGLRMSSIPIDQTIIFSKAEDVMDLTQSHSMAINRNSMLLGERFHLPVPPVSGDKTVVFTCNQDEMDITKSHTVAIDKKVVDDTGYPSVQPLQRNINRESINERVHLPVPATSSDKSVVFICDQDEMDITRSHTVAIDNRVVNEEGGSGTQLLQRNGNRKSVTGARMSSVPIDQTIIFSKAEDVMDLTQSHSMAINRNSMLLGERYHLLVPPVSSDKTVVFTCNQDEMDITKSHTVAIDNKVVDDTGCPSVQPLQRNINRESINERVHLPVPATSSDKSVVFICDQDEMDITRSHTVTIDNRVVNEEGGSGTQLLQRNGNRKSVTGSRMSSVPVDQTTLFSETVDGMDLANSYNMTVKKNSMLLGERQQLSVHPVSSDKTDVFTCDQDKMDVINVANDNKVVDKDGDSVMQPLQRSSNRKSMSSLRTPSVPVDQAIEFLKTEDGMDLTNNNSFAIKSNSMLLGERQHLPLPLVTDDKTMVFTCDQDEMDIANSHTVVIDNKVADEAGCPGVQILQRDTNRQTITEKANFPVPQVSIENAVVFTRDQDDMNEKSDVTIDSNDIKNDDNEALKKQMLDGCSIFCQDTPSSIHSQSLENLSIPKSGKLSENVMKYYTFMPESIENKPIYISLEPCVKKEETCARQLQHIPTLPFPIHNEEQNNLNRNEVNMSLNDGNLKVIDDTKKWVSNVEKAKILISDQENINTCVKEMMENEERPDCETITNSNTSFSNAEQLPSVATAPVESVTLNTSYQKEFRQTGIADIHVKLRSLKRKSELCSEVNHTEQYNTAISHPDSYIQLEVLPQTHLSGRMRGKHIDDGYLEDRKHKTEDNKIASVETESKNINKLKRMPFGAYPPKLPNKRNSNASDTVCMEERTGFHFSDLHVDTGKTPKARPNIVQNINISECINEEMFPSSLEDLDSNGSVKVEVPEWTQEENCEKEVVHNLCGSEPGEINKSQKRVRDSEEKVELLKKKVKRNEVESDCNTNRYQAFHIANATVPDNLAETGESENLPIILAKSLDGNYSSSSSQDSRVDGTSVDLGSQRCSLIEDQFLMVGDSDHSLWQKLQDGIITVREFFLLLHVHVQIQRPRHSELPANHKLISDPTLEDLLVDQNIYYPKLLVYQEDCQALCQAIEKLKLYVSTQDKPLVDVNSLLWEAMKTCSVEELRNFGLELKRIKSCFTKKSKVMCHEEKMKLYSKLLQTSQVQLKKLKSRNDELDCLLEEMDSCISALETELENLKNRESKCFSELSSLEEQKQKLLTQINSLQKEAKTIGKQLERYNFSEWELYEWAQDHAIFTFLYDSLEFTITFGDPIDGALFNNKPCKAISDVTFESLIDDDRAPPSSLLIHRLISQYIESKGSLPMKYATQHQLPQLLFEVSLVVHRCRLLGEEIEFLMKWGGMFNILKTEVHNTEVKLLFSSSAAFAKFEVTICLSSNYPACPLSLTVLKHIGNIGQDEIYTVLSDVPLGINYLRRAVNRIHQNLLQETPLLSVLVNV